MGYIGICMFANSLLNPAIALHGGVSYFAFACLSVCVCVCVRYQNISKKY